MHCFAGRNPRSWSTSAGCAAVGSTCSNYIYAVLTAKKRLSTGITRGHVVACELIIAVLPLPLYCPDRGERVESWRCRWRQRALVPTPPGSERGGGMRVRPAARGPRLALAVTRNGCVRLLEGLSKVFGLGEYNALRHCAH